MIKIAVNRVLAENCLPKGADGPVVLTLEAGRVLEVRPLSREEAFTIWLGGEVRLRRMDGLLTAWRGGKRLDENLF